MKLATLILVGYASWYGQGDPGGTYVASGGRYNENAPTCAHKTYPFGTKLMVTNKRNGKTTYCTVNDRGPYVKGRVIDLSKKGAKDLGMLDSGIAPVEVAVVQPSLSPKQQPPLKVIVPDPYEVDRQDLPPVVDKSPKQSRSKVSQGRGKSRSLGQRPPRKTKLLSASEETLRNLRSI